MDIFQLGHSNPWNGDISVAHDARHKLAAFCSVGEPNSWKSPEFSLPKSSVRFARTHVGRRGPTFMLYERTMAGYKDQTPSPEAAFKGQQKQNASKRFMEPTRPKQNIPSFVACP